MVDCLNNDTVRQFLCATQLAAINLKVNLNVSFNKLMGLIYIIFLLQNISKEVDFILTILSHPILKKYPLKTTYITRFLKAIISQVGMKYKN